MGYQVVQRVLLIVLIAGSCIGCDRMTKSMAMNDLQRGIRLSFASDLIRLQYEENSGAMLSIGSDLPPGVRFWVFTVLIGGLLGGLFVFVLLTRSVGPGDVVAASLVLGGGFGNLIDRIMYDGVVIDFLNIGVGGLRTAVFNVADVSVISGVALIVVLHLRHGSEPSSPEQPQP
jgi:signal peptidase II